MIFPTVERNKSAVTTAASTHNVSACGGRQSGMRAIHSAQLNPARRAAKHPAADTARRPSRSRMDEPRSDQMTTDLFRAHISVLAICPHCRQAVLQIPPSSPSLALLFRFVLFYSCWGQSNHFSAREGDPLPKTSSLLLYCYALRALPSPVVLMRGSKTIIFRLGRAGWEFGESEESLTRLRTSPAPRLLPFRVTFPEQAHRPNTPNRAPKGAGNLQVWLGFFFFLAAASPSAV